MTRRMLIDASHAEETRVALLDGNRIEDYDIETAGRRQLKGNIYLAKVVRVEPSLQAAFVEYGGNRHGFLAFGEIHPDYYQIPVADRQRLLEMQEAEAREEEEEEDRAAERGAERGPERGARADPDAAPAVPDAAPDTAEDGTPGAIPEPGRATQAAATAIGMRVAPEEARDEFPASPSFADTADVPPEGGRDYDSPEGARDDDSPHDLPGADLAPEAAEPSSRPPEASAREDAPPSEAEELLEGPLTGEVLSADDEDTTEDASADSRPAPETVGGEGDDRRERRPPPRFLRNYKIQEVIRRRQILLIQVVKEERGTKGAALTTYISLAGRFSVLMPNSPRGGGISRKITSTADRRRLKEVTAELGLPRGMGLIVRTAGANRPKAEILRDCEYLLNQWEQIRDLTLRSVAPALIYEEASLIKRAMRDLYSREVEEVQVDGEAGWKAARDFMRMLMPDAARKVQLWREPLPLFAKHGVEQQLDALLAPVVQLRSGGYLVINQTEALVAIDVNSGRSTRERGIEETALRTNMEAAEEIARQLRLRDLAGLVVMDFIDMEGRRNNTMVERRLKDALKDDRARIQVGSISHFGLLEMSRQRLRPSLVETNFVLCPHCGGLGHVRGIESSALHVLRAVEEEGAKRKAAEIVVHCAAEVALYILNHKRGRLAEIESRSAMRVAFAADPAMAGAQLRLERVRAQAALEAPAPVSQIAPAIEEDDEPLAPEAEGAEAEETPEARGEAPGEVPGEVPGEAPGEDGEQRRRRRRRRSRGRGRPEGPEPEGAEPEGAEPEGAEPEGAEPEGAEPEGAEPEGAEPEGAEPEGAGLDADEGAGEESLVEVGGEAAEARTEETSDEPGRRRRGRRGGRRRRREGEPEAEAEEQPSATPEVPAYAGPTPADPFGGGAFDIFDVLERVEEQRASAAAPEPPGAAEAPGNEAFAQHATAEADAPREAAPVSPEFAAPEVASPGAEAAPAEPAPLIVPVLVGGGEAPVAPKRGWWRR